MRIKLWNAPYNGAWVWFDRANLRRFDFGARAGVVWWAVLGFSGKITIQTWPWQTRHSEA